MTFAKCRTWTVLGLFASLAALSACAHEVSHSESDKPGWFGGHTHEETTVYENPDGSRSVSHEKESTNP